MVCTKDTGIRDMASELRMWPPIWKAVSGKVAMMMSLLGLRMPFFSTGKASRTDLLCLASQAKNRHHPVTRKNWMMVRVTGRFKVVRIDFDEVLVMIEVAYQKRHSNLEASA